MNSKKTLRAAAAGCAALLHTVCISSLPNLPVQAAGTVVINEVCTKNTTVPASDGLFYDYIELYNTGSSEVSVGGYSLTDNPSKPAQYVIPEGTVIPAKGYCVIYCDVAPDSSIKGAAFGLSKDGETIIFADASGNTVETCTVPALAADTAYGRIPDGSDSFGILSKLSAGSTNPAAAATVAIPEPGFSQGSGFYSSGFDLTLTAPDGCTVYYTTDGSDPTTASEKFSGSIKIYDKSSEPDVYAAKTDIADGYKAPTEPVRKAMIVRAISVDAQGNQSEIATNTYFIGYSQNDTAMTMRVISLVTDPDNLFDYEKGIYVKGKIYDTSQGNMMQSWEHPANYTQSGREWERPAHITVFEQGQATYSTGVGIRMHGGATRSSAQKSFNLYARLEYGSRKIEYDFFGGTVKNVSGKVIKSFDKLSLRNGGNDEKTKIRDRLNQEMVQDRAYGTQAQTECIVFLDGEFWGVYNIIEKLGKEYISDHYKVSEDDVCMIKNDELSDGTSKGWADYEALQELALNGDFSDEKTFEKFAQTVDIKSFADYMATEMIVGNSDFGENNFCLWKTETVDSTKTYADGKWRFLLFDTEYGQGLYNQSNESANILQNLRQLANKGEWLPALFINLMKSENEFYHQFVASYYDQCNVNFAPDRVTARLQELSELYKPAMIETIQRYSWGSSGMGDWGWGGGWDFPGMPGQQPDKSESVFTNEINTISSFWKNRASRAEQQIPQWLTDLPQQLCTITIQSEKPVQFNTLTLPAGSWSGTYPQSILYQLAAPAGLNSWETSGVTLSGCTKNDSAIRFEATTTAAALKALYSAGAYSKSDVSALLAHLLTKSPLTAQTAASYDMDGNGILNAADLTILKQKV